MMVILQKKFHRLFASSFLFRQGTVICLHGDFFPAARHSLLKSSVSSVKNAPSKRTYRLRVIKNR